MEQQGFLFPGVLNAGFLEVLQNHGAEVLLLAGFLLAHRAVVILVGGREHAMGRETLHRERGTDTDPFLVFVRLVVKGFGIGMFAIAAAMAPRFMPSLMSGLLAMDLRVTCGTRL